uniref:Uncharacterized protein n=1 Tax=viral metagenome TaxID=1070528 RepID=A0A6C0FC21_9ZZZZ|tara:strand:+ start:271 stop:483 length:213 start_codon:yes stop_codon:yes gene_type:complete
MNDIASIFVAIAIVFGLICCLWIVLLCISVLVEYGAENENDLEREVTVNKMHSISEKAYESDVDSNASTV